MPAALAVSLGLGALFSLGIVFVRDVLDASDAEFGVLIALFGVGAVVGLVALQRLPSGNLLARTRVGVLWIGVVVAVFSLAPALVGRALRRGRVRRRCRVLARRRYGRHPVVTRRS